MCRIVGTNINNVIEEAKLAKLAEIGKLSISTRIKIPFWASFTERKSSLHFLVSKWDDDNLHGLQQETDPTFVPFLSLEKVKSYNLFEDHR